MTKNGIKPYLSLGEIDFSGALKGKGAEDSFGGLALKIAGFTSLANLAVAGGKKLVQTTVDLAKQSVALAAGFEKARVTWGVLVGDMDMGAKVFEDIRDFAAATPLSFEGLNQAATVVKGFGVATADIIPTLSKLGDVAMGDNAKLQSLALVYGQTMAQGKAKTQDLYQFINAGVPIFNMLAESMNVSAGEIKDLAAEGAITFEEIDKAITKATSAGGKFYGMMEKTAETAMGKWSTAQDNFQQQLAALGESWLPMVTSALDAANREMERWNRNRAAATAASTEASLVQLIGKGDKAGAIEAANKMMLAALQEAYKLAKAANPLATAAQQAALDSVNALLRGRATIAPASGASSSAEAPGLSAWQKSLQGITGDTIMDVAISKITDEAGRLAEVAALTGGALVDPFEDARKKLVELYEAMYMTGNLGPEWRGKLVAAIDDTDLAIKAASDSTTKWGDDLANGLAPAGRATLIVNEALASIYEDLDDRMKTLSMTGLDYLTLEDEMYAAQVRNAGGTEAEVAAIQDKVNALRNLTEEESALKKFEQSIERINNAFSNSAMDAWVEGFRSLGEAWTTGANAGDTFADAMKQVGMQLLNQLPLLLLSAGLQAMIGPPPNIPLGLALIGASGLVAIGSGVVGSGESEEANALGGVYTSPSLHSYVNGVYNTPKTFAFGNGAAFGWEGMRAFARMIRGEFEQLDYYGVT